MADKIITLFTTPLLEKDRQRKIIIKSMIQEYFQNSPGCYTFYLGMRKRDFLPRGTTDDKIAHAFSERLEFVIHIVLCIWPKRLRNEVEKQMWARGRANGIFDDFNDVDNYSKKCVLCNENHHDDDDDNDNNDKYVIDAELLDFLGEECQLDLQYHTIRMIKTGVTYLWSFVHKLLQDDYEYYAELIKVCNHLVRYYTGNAYDLANALPAALKRQVEDCCNRKSINFFKKSRYWPHYSGYLLFDEDTLQYREPIGMDNLSQLYDAFDKRVTMKDQRVLPKPHSVIAMLEQMIVIWFTSPQYSVLPDPHAKALLTMNIDYRATGDAVNIRQFVNMLRARSLTR